MRTIGLSLISWSAIPYREVETGFLIRKLGYQLVMAGTRILAAMFVIASSAAGLLSLIAVAGFPVADELIILVSFIVGVPLGLWTVYKKEWVGRFAQSVEKSRMERLSLLLSTVNPGSPVVEMSQLPETTSSYSGSTLTDQYESSTRQNHPVSFSENGCGFAFFTVSEERLRHVTLTFETTFVVDDADANPQEPYTTAVSKESSSVRYNSFDEKSTESLAMQCYESLFEQFGSEIPAPVIKGDSWKTVIELENPVSIVGENSRVTKVELRTGVHLRSVNAGPQNIELLTQTYHPELSSGETVA